MAINLLLFLPFFLQLLITISTDPIENTFINPIQCSNPSPNATCNSILYVTSKGLSPATVASLYSANATLIQNITRPSVPDPDFLVQVPCQCEDVGNGTIAYFHDTKYTVQPGDTLNNIRTNIFSGLAWVNIGDNIEAGRMILIHLPCGCYESNAKVEVVSYAVEKGDTISTISSLFSADVGEIQKMNAKLLQNPEFLVVGWVLFVPMGTAAPPSP